MEQIDRGNLIFLLSTFKKGGSELEQFLDTLDLDELEYALNLLQQFNQRKESLLESLMD